MKILAVAFAYNEIKYLPAMVRYYRKQGCDLFILDNESDDGTTKWLKRHKVKSKILSTSGTFHLLKLQAGLVEYIRETKPDWVVYTGVDIIYSFETTIRETIERADKEGYNLIGVRHYNMFNTGEDYKTSFYKNYFYCRRGNFLFMIAKYSEPFGFEADSIQIDNTEKKLLKVEGVLINYGNCKPKEERIKTYKRRYKAWEEGLNRNYGVHYIEGMQKNWIWEKKEMLDIRLLGNYRFIKNLKI